MVRMQGRNFEPTDRRSLDVETGEEIVYVERDPVGYHPAELPPVTNYGDQRYLRMSQELRHGGTPTKRRILGLLVAAPFLVPLLVRVIVAVTSRF